MKGLNVWPPKDNVDGMKKGSDIWRWRDIGAFFVDVLLDFSGLQVKSMRL